MQFILLFVFCFVSFIYVNSISPLSIKGTKFFNADGEQFYFKGVAYQRSQKDPFVNVTQCQLDAALMKTLGANVIRAYHVDPNGDHDGCMEAFSEAGIYLFLDLDTFDTQIQESDPMWNMTMFTDFTQVIDAFDKYDNLAGFFVANEAVTQPSGIDAAPYVKAATRDTKAYMKNTGGRYIPIGYSAADISSIRPMFQNYLVCGPEDDTIDFFAVNIYEWCGDVTYQTSGYADRMNELQGYPIPVFFSEDGCNLVRPRTFRDLAAVYGPEMTPIMSGSIIYEWTQEANDYGIVQYPDTCIQDGITAPVGVPIPLQPEFDNLKSAWAAASPSSIAETNYNPSTVVIECPATTSGTWTIDGNAKLPETPGNLTAKKPEKFTFTGTLSSVTVDVTGIFVSVYTSGATGTTPTALSSSGSAGESGSSAQGTAASAASVASRGEFSERLWIFVGFVILFRFGA